MECYKKNFMGLEGICDEEKIAYIAEYLKDTWQVFCLKELCETSGAMVSIDSINRALSSADSDCDPMLHLLLLEAFRSSRGRRWERTTTAVRIRTINESARNSVVDGVKIPSCLAKELLETLRFFGVPDAIIDESEKPGLWRKIKEQCHLNRSKIFEFSPLLERFLGNKKREIPYSEARRNARREIKRVMNGARTISRSKLWSKCRSAMKWAIENDREWFDRVAPRQQSEFANKDFFQVRNMMREKIGRAVNGNPGWSRTKLWSTHKRELLWASKQDTEWLRKIMPVRAKEEVADKPYSVVRREMRHEIKDAVDRGVVRSRTELWRQRQTAMKWAAAHDKEWLGKIAPGRPMPRVLAGKPYPVARRVARGQIKDAVDRGVARSRSELWRRYQTSMQWLITHDKGWLDKTVPTKRSSGK
ncbi:hypothetical protein PQQ86_24970 [Paraburkholderia sediminicola]|uniref:hypothetical protein n=1 Tax=Paraburkholderia sediminicola TaxID=458836 RepID=UPI0038BD2848